MQAIPLHHRTALFVAFPLLAALVLQGCAHDINQTANNYTLKVYERKDSPSLYGDAGKGSVVRARANGNVSSLELFVDRDRQLWVFYKDQNYPKIIRVGPNPEPQSLINQEASNLKNTLTRIVLKKCYSDQLCGDINFAGYLDFNAWQNGPELFLKYVDYSITKKEFASYYKYFEGIESWEHLSVIDAKQTNAVINFDTALAKIKNISNKDSLQKSKEFAKFLGVDAQPLLASAYSRRFKELNYKSAYEAAKSAEELIAFAREYRDYNPDGLVEKARQNLASLYRKQNSATGYWKAFDLLGEKSDFVSLQRAAKSSSELTLLANAVFKAANQYAQFFAVDFGFDNSQLKTREQTNAGVFSMYEFFGHQVISGKGSIKPAITSPLLHSKATYRIKLVANLSIPRSRQVRSNVVGNSDRSPETTSSKELMFNISPPYQQSFELDFGSFNIIYFDRGSRGGYTADWIIGDPKISIKVTSVQALEN